MFHIRCSGISALEVAISYAGGGASSNCGRPSSRTSHGCFEAVKKCMSGENSVGSSSDPEVTPMTPAFSRRENMVEPQCGQNPRLISGDELAMASGPSTVTASI